MPRSLLGLFLIVYCLTGALLSTARAATSPPSGSRYDDSQEHVFLPDEVTTIEVRMADADLDFLLDPRNSSSREYKPCTVRVINSVIDETIIDVGIRLRGNTSRTARKKSWKLSFNAFVPGQRFHGLKKLNINGEHNDVSISRSRLAFDTYRAFALAAPRVHHVHFKINNGNRVSGAFANVEQIDDDFVNAWFGTDDGNLYKCAYKGARADLRYVFPGTPTTYSQLGGGRTYQIEIDERGSAYEDLAAFIDFVNNATDAEFAAGLFDLFSVDTFLRAMAIDVTIGHWDNYWYGANNYYLYSNPETGRFEYIPFDLDNTLGVDFFNIDWSKRSYTTFGNGGFGSNPGIPPLVTRIFKVPAWQQQYRRYLRELVGGSDDPEAPFDDLFCPLDAILEELEPLREMLAPIAYRGTFRGSTMDWSFNNALFLASFTEPAAFNPSLNPRGWGIGPYVEARKSWLRANVSVPPPRPAISINEVLPVNDTVHADEVGDFDDWFELYNDNEDPVDIGGMYLTDDPALPKKWLVPAGTSIPGKGFLLIWADLGESDGPLHASFRLSGEGESLALFDTDERGNVLIDMLTYPSLAADVSYGRFPDGGNHLEEFHSVTPLAANGDSTIEPLGPFLRGDCNGDSEITIADPVSSLFFTFMGQPVTCQAACDANADGGISSVDDSIFLLSFLFLGGESPTAPFPLCGVSNLPTDGLIGCETAPSACGK